MAEFYSARGWEIPPLPWTNLSPPFSHGRAVGLVAVLTGLPFAFQPIDYNLEPDNSSDHAGDVIFGRILDGFVKLTGFTPKSR